MYDPVIFLINLRDEPFLPLSLFLCEFQSLDASQLLMMIESLNFVRRHFRPTSDLCQVAIFYC